MKILITTDMYFPVVTGVAQVIKLQADSLRRLGHDVRVMTIAKCRQSHYNEKDNVYYIKAAKFTFYKDSFMSFNLSDKMVPLIVTWKPDLIHSQCEFFSLKFAKKISTETGAPIIHTCHTDFPSYRDYFFKSYTLWKSIVPGMVKRALDNESIKLVITPSVKTQKMLRDFAIERPITVLPSGINLHQFKVRLSEQEKKVLLAPYGVKTSDFIIVSICRLTEEKKVRETIDNFAQLHIRDARLLIIGDGDQRSALEAQVQELGLQKSVKFFGMVPSSDVWMYYQLGDVFVSSSESETQGLTYYEACASGVPIVCKKDDCLTVMMEEGKNGYCFTTSEEFLKIIHLCYTDLEKLNRMSAYAPLSVARFSGEAFAQNLLDIYRQYVS